MTPHYEIPKTRQGPFPIQLHPPADFIEFKTILTKQGYDIHDYDPHAALSGIASVLRSQRERRLLNSPRPHLRPTGEVFKTWECLGRGLCVQGHSRDDAYSQWCHAVCLPDPLAQVPTPHYHSVPTMVGDSFTIEES